MERNYYSTKNQDILRQLVSREVLMNGTAMVEFILRSESNEAPFSYEDAVNAYYKVCPDCGSVLSETDNPGIYKCDDCDELYEESEIVEEEKEVCEWWFVTEYFARKLEAQGELVIHAGHHIWGRLGSGQAIYLDSVIGRIGEEMEILEGMRYDWSRRD